MTIQEFNGLEVGDIITFNFSGKDIEIIRKDSPNVLYACNGVCHFPVTISMRNEYSLAVCSALICTHEVI